MKTFKVSWYLKASEKHNENKKVKKKCRLVGVKADLKQYILK